MDDIVTDHQKFKSKFESLIQFDDVDFVSPYLEEKNFEKYNHVYVVVLNIFDVRISTYFHKSSKIEINWEKKICI